MNDSFTSDNIHNPNEISHANSPQSPRESGFRKNNDNRAEANNRAETNNRPNRNKNPNSKSQRPPRNTSFRTPASLSTMPRHVETALENRRNHINAANHAPSEPKKRPDGRIVRQPFNGQAHLYEVIQARLVRTQRLVEVNTGGIHLADNEYVLIRFHRNILLASTVGRRYRRVAEINSLPFVVRIADDDDMRIDAENAVFEKHAHELASEYAIAQNLQMKVLSTDLSHDHKNVTINFASDVRVDFRDMVAYLASKLKMRVEMFQLGLRNGTGLICGLGSCGQLLCCGRFLGQFDPIAVRQLRAQGLAANPKRISGVCGRLYCCMSYEYCEYTHDKRALPKKGKRVLTRWGIGRVTDIDMLREEIVMIYDNGEIQRMTTRDYVPLTDEMQADIEAGKIEFPLEPARFYLNADPSAAFEPENSARTQRNNPKALRETQAFTKKISVSKPQNKSTSKKSAPHQPAPKHKPQPAQKAPSSNKDKEPKAPLDTRPTPKPGDKNRKAHKRPIPDRNSKAIGIVPQPTTPTPNSVLVPTPDPGTARTLAHANPADINRGPRIPRKVKARQSNLDDTLPTGQHEAGHSSRRNLPNQGLSNKPSDPQG